jgi:hypothetical protein
MEHLDWTTDKAAPHLRGQRVAVVDHTTRGDYYAVTTGSEEAASIDWCEQYPEINALPVGSMICIIDNYQPDGNGEKTQQA